MLIDLVKGTVIGIIIWLISTSSSSLITLAFGETVAVGSIIVITPAIALIFSWYYLDNEDITSKISEGLKLGLLWLILNLALDFLVMSFLLGIGFNYFFKWYLWIGYVEIIIPCLVVGYFIAKTKKRWLRE